MTTGYQGDPKIFLDENGSYFKFTGGQPVMDQGLENMALISLFTQKGWIGNQFLPEESQLGSDFEKTANEPITISSLENLRRAADNALDNDAFGGKDIEVSNPINYRLDVTATIEPPGKDSGILAVSKNGENWISQNTNPAHKG